MSNKRLRTTGHLFRIVFVIKDTESCKLIKFIYWRKHFPIRTNFQFVFVKVMVMVLYNYYALLNLNLKEDLPLFTEHNGRHNEQYHIYTHKYVLGMQRKLNDLEAELRSASDKSSKKKDRLNQTIEGLEAELKAAKTELKEQVFANTLAVAETTSLENKIQSAALANIESNERKECEIDGLKELLEKSNAEKEQLREQLRAGRQEIDNYKLRERNARRQFGELERMHKINGNLMKSIQHSLSSNVNTSQKSKCPYCVHFHIKASSQKFGFDPFHSYVKACLTEKKKWPFT